MLYVREKCSNKHFKTVGIPTNIINKDITNVKRVLDSSQEFIAEEVPKTQDEITADWLFAKDSSFIKSYWRFVIVYC